YPLSLHDALPIFRRNLVLVAFGEPCGAGDNRPHLAGEPAEVIARLVVGDLVELAEAPEAGEPRGLRLQVGRRRAGETDRLERLRERHLRVEIVVYEETPDVLVRVLADQRL